MSPARMLKLLETPILTGKTGIAKRVPADLVIIALWLKRGAVQPRDDGRRAVCSKRDGVDRMAASTGVGRGGERRKSPRPRNSS